MARPPTELIWVVEEGVFPESHSQLGAAATAFGHRVVKWRDEWWSAANWPRFDGSQVVFHGSLGNAARIRTATGWRPGAFCDVPAFQCSTWYPRATKWLLNQRWTILPAHDFVERSAQVLDELACGDAAFVRPDSPLKPFSGRILKRGGITMAALDFGFYFDDPGIPVVVAPVEVVRREWRCVVAKREVVAASSYEASDRKAVHGRVEAEVLAFAAEIAREMRAPEAVHVMDVCESAGGLRLLELNPFSGADMYGYAPDAVVKAVAEAVRHAEDAH